MLDSDRVALKLVSIFGYDLVYPVTSYFRNLFWYSSLVNVTVVVNLNYSGLYKLFRSTFYEQVALLLQSEHCSFFESCSIKIMKS